MIGLDLNNKIPGQGVRVSVHPFLVALGSAPMMIVSRYGFADILTHTGVGLDPSRIAAQVVSGIASSGGYNHPPAGWCGLTTAGGSGPRRASGLRPGHMYIVAAAATLLTLFALEVLTLVFGDCGRRRTMVVFSAASRAAVDDMFGNCRAANMR